MPENTRSSELEVLLRAYLKSATSSTGDWAAEEEEINRRISDIESYIASKVEEARIESERAGIYWVRNKVVTSGRDESGKFYLLDDAFVSEVDAYLEALQSNKEDR